jgi:peptidoglycan hydrolase-like protein with peptidoglycan-binding domain
MLAAIASAALAASCALASETTRAVQEELRRRHLFYGDIDGRETPNLIEALRRYQERKGFPPTGVADEATLRSMGVHDGGMDEPAALPDAPILRSDRGISLGAQEPGPPVAAAPQPGATAAPEPSAEEMRTFVRRYLDACKSRNIDDELAFYADRVDYFHHGTVDKNYIRKELDGYVQQWPARIYTVGEKIAVEQKGDKTVVRCRVNFGLENPGRSRRASGQTDSTFTLARRADGWEIVGHQEERVRRQSSSRSSAKRKTKKPTMSPLDRTLRKFFGSGSRPPPPKKKRK